MSRINAYTLRTNRIEEGIVVERRRGQPGICLGTRVNHTFVPFGSHGQLIPAIGEDNLFLAGEPAQEKIGGPRNVVSRGTWSGALLHVIAAELDFGVSPYAEGLSFYAGGECKPQEIAFCGRMGKPERRQQLFAIEDGSELWLVDRNCGSVIVSVSDCATRMRRATRDDVIANVVKVGLEVGLPRSLRWGYHNLVTLGAEAHAGPLLEALSNLGQPLIREGD